MSYARGPEPYDLLMSVRLPMVPQSAETARRQVRVALDSHGAEKDAIDTAELLASELVTNGLLHARGLAGSELVLSLIRDGGSVIIEVHDPSRELPYAISPPDGMSESGRGLFLVAALSTDHGIHLTEEAGKVVWCELPVWPAP